MGVLLAAHLGVVLALFVTIPYGNFVHGIYRLAALIRYAQERRLLVGEGEREGLTVRSTGQGGTRP
jgi:citrate/tricarballylate utilization protein